VVRARGFVTPARRSCGNDAAAAVAALGPRSMNPVGFAITSRLCSIKHHGVAGVDQPLRTWISFLDVGHVQRQVGSQSSPNGTACVSVPPARPGRVPRIIAVDPAPWRFR